METSAAGSSVLGVARLLRVYCLTGDYYRADDILSRRSNKWRHKISRGTRSCSAYSEEGIRDEINPIDFVDILGSENKTMAWRSRYFNLGLSINERLSDS